MSDYKKSIEYNGKKLPDVFKELKEKQNENINSQIISVLDKKILYNKNKFNLKKIFSIKLRTANNFFIAILIICFIIIMLLTNSISATQIEINRYNKNSNVQFEKNENSLDIMAVLNDNMSVVKRKEIVTEQADINFMTTYRENSNLPKDEQILMQVGSLGKQEITIVRTYENNELVEENIISINIFEDSVEQIIEIGSSEFLADLKIHLGDNVYARADTSLREMPDNNSNVLAYVPQYYDAKILETSENWAKVEFNNQIGYIENSVLTSAFVESDIADKCRIKKVKSNLDINMELNKPSGLDISDYQKIFSDINSDRNKIFENNAVVFYNIEQKYNINGIFLASIAIHESAWGSSKIAKDKKNLFGYGSYDATPYQSSISFDSYDAGIEVVAKVLVKNYLNPSGTVICDGEIATGAYYNGPTVSGVNIRYASDTNWYLKIFSKMLYLYDRL